MKSNTNKINESDDLEANKRMQMADTLMNKVKSVVPEINVGDWKTVPFGQIMNTIDKNIQMTVKLLEKESGRPVVQESNGPRILTERFWSDPKNENSKFWDMSGYELFQYASKSEKKRQEIRKFIMSNWEYASKSMPSILRYIAELNQNLSRKTGNDPFDPLHIYKAYDPNLMDKQEFTKAQRIVFTTICWIIYGGSILAALFLS